MVRNLALSVSILLLAASFSEVAAKDKVSSQVVEIEELGAGPGVDIPADFRASLSSDILEQLRKLHFKDVRRGGDGVNEDAAPALLLGGTITAFDRGSRAERYMVPGMGATRVKAHIAVRDKKSGETLYETDVSGSVHWGLFGGNSMGATRGLAKSVAKKIKGRFL